MLPGAKPPSQQKDVVPTTDDLDGLPDDLPDFSDDEEENQAGSSTRASSQTR